MNKFTKEELKDIEYALETVYLGNSNLRKKVLSMIESYDSTDNVSLICKFTKSNHMLDPDNRICMTCNTYVPIELTQQAIHFTTSQIDHICYQIGEWYLMMKPLLEGQHNLGYMKEKLKTMICGE